MLQQPADVAVDSVVAADQLTPLQLPLDLVAQLTDDLGVAGRERFFPTIPAPFESVRATVFFRLEILRAAIIRGTGGGSMNDAEFDIRPAASRWTRQYAASLWPAVPVAL